MRAVPKEAIKKKITPEDLGGAKDKMTMVEPHCLAIRTKSL
jgi:hypothetical protein